MATHSGILVWEIPWTEESGGLQAMESQESDTTKWLNYNNQQFYKFKLEKLEKMAQFLKITNCQLSSTCNGLTE